jgi:amino acid transporter/nucleotide-binding universal stress UspA family protein
MGGGETKGGLVRELGLAEALSIGLGTMIGAGIFVLSVVAAERAGPAATLSYVAAGLICVPIAMTVSELATGMPRAGGSYYLISRALGPLAGSIVGPGNWLGLTFATGFYLIGFAQYIAFFLPIPVRAAAVLGGLVFVFLNYRGAKLSGSVQKYIVVLLVLILTSFAVRGLFAVDSQLLQPFAPHGWGAVIANVGLIIVSFTGFEKVSTVAEEIKEPGRNLPLAIISSVLIATVLYAAVLYVMTGTLHREALAGYEAPIVEAARRTLGTVGAVAMSLAALLATASSANAAIMASSRINFAMGRDHILPGWFNEIHARFMTPYRSVLVTGALAILLALSGQAEVLAEISSALFMVSYSLLSLSLVVMRRTRPAWYRPAYRVPLFPWFSLLGGVLSLAVIGTMDHFSQLAGLGLVGLSLVWYTFWGRRRTQVRGELVPWMERERPLEAVISSAQRAAEGQPGEILVAVANPATAKSLVTLAASLARARQGTAVAALRIVEVPIGLPAQAAQEYLQRHSGEHQDILRRAAKHGAVAGVRVQMLLQAAHGVGTGIVAVAESRPDTRLILLGWHGPLTLTRIRSHVMKEVVRMAPCDVAVFLDRHPGELKRITVPVGGGPHARLGLRLAYDLALSQGAQLDALRVVRPAEETDLASEEASLQRLMEAELGTCGGCLSARVVEADSAVEAIIQNARHDCDLVVIGASEEWFFRNWLFGAIPDQVAAHVPCSVLLVRRREPAPVSWLRRVTKGLRGQQTPQDDSQ